MKKLIKELRLENTTKEDLLDDLINCVIMFGGMYLILIHL